MIIIYKELVQKYISYLTPTHIKEYADSQNISVSEQEVLILHQFIQKNYKQLLDDNTTITKLKPLLREDLYKKVYALYQENKAKYC